MKKVFYIILLLLLSCMAEGQQLPHYSQYLMNNFLLNPAIAGTEDFIPVRLTAKQQWIGISGAPGTQSLSAHSVITRNRNMGIGGYIFNDQYGPFGKTGIQGSYSYHLPIGIGSKLALGISVSAYQFVFDQSNLELIEEDSDISYEKEKKFIPDAGFGAHFFSKKYFIGFAASQLFQQKVKYEVNESDDNRLNRQYYITAGYKFDVGKDFIIEPSFLFKATRRVPVQIDINARIYYKKNYWLGLSYRSKEAFVTLIGLRLDRYFIGYAFDYYFADIQKDTFGSHEIILGVNLRTGKGTSIF